MRPPVTMAQIARRCGVSRPAVSYALNFRDDQISVEVATRIRRTARELGYRPHAAAQSLKRGSFHTLSLLYGPHSYLPKEFLDALIDGADARRFRIDLTSVDHGRLADPGYQPNILRTHFADGVLLDNGGLAPDEVVTRLEASGSPTVTVNWNRPFNAVIPDDRGAGRAAAEQFLARGHRSALCVTQYTADVGRFGLRERRDGFVDAFRAGGGTVALIEDIGGGSVHWQGLHTFFSAPGRPTAVFAVSEFTASMAGGALMAAGLRPPTDISVLAVSDRRFAHWGRETSCLLIPWPEVAEAALTLLTDRLADPERADRPALCIPFGEPTAFNTLGPAPY